MEAAMTLPVFILVFVALALVVDIIASCEEMVFRQCGHVYEMDMKAPQIFPNPKKEGYKVKSFRYLYYSDGIDDLISLDSESDFEIRDPIGIMGKIEFRLDILSRGYTGALQHSDALMEEDFTDGEASQTVIIFPKYGIRFHSPGCRYVLQEYEGEEVRLEMDKRDAEMKGYTPCLVCNGG